MRFTPHLLGLGILLSATAGAMAKPAYVASTVNLRAAPGTTSDVVAKIPGGSLIDADNCTEGWCAVTWQGKSGFAIQSALDMSGRVPQQQRAAGPRMRQPVYADGPGEEEIVVGPPGYYAPPPPPVYYGYGSYYRPYGRRRRW
jgi:hypothetical protein